MKIKKRHLSISAIILAICIIAIIIYIMPGYEPLTFPGNKTFAFSICDDTDRSTLENIKPVYEFLDSLGLKTTKTVWIYPSNNLEKWPNRGETLSDSLYRSYIMDLKDRGFEIASHGARGGSTKRDKNLQAFEDYKNIIGEYPRIYINHYKNIENLYWGKDKLSFGPIKTLYKLKKNDVNYLGHIEDSEYFWGDFARDNIDYVVNFSFFEINIMKVNPEMPYHDPEKPYVNFWFHTSDGGTVEKFNDLLSKENIDRLEKEGGVCIVYTHFGVEFCENGKLNEETREKLKYLASKNGWFAPTGEILDYLKNRHNNNEITFRQRLYLELYWIFDKII
jgi:hypothetical protein